MRILSLATALMASVYFASDASLAGGTKGETDTIDGVKIKLTKQDVDNALELAKDEGWTKEQVLTVAHGLVLRGDFETVSEALASGVQSFRDDPSGAMPYADAMASIGATTAIAGVASLSDLYGDDLADDDGDFGPADPEDDDVIAFLDDLFSDDDDDRD